MKELALTSGDSLKDSSECYMSHMIPMVSCTLLLPSGGVGGGREEMSCVDRKWMQFPPLHITSISPEHFIVDCCLVHI